MRPWISGCLASSVFGLTVLGGCQEAGSSEGDDLGTIQLAVTAVPMDVSCLRASVTGARGTVVRRISAMAGAPATGKLAGLPVGNVTLLLDALPVACDDITPATEATWVSEPISLVLVPGVPQTVNVVMRQNGRIDLDVDFIPDPSSVYTYTEAFTSGVSTTPEQCMEWQGFIAGLGSSYTSMTFTGSLAGAGITCNDPAAVNAIAESLRTQSNFSVTCNGHVWSNCGTRYFGEVWIDPPALCDGNNCPAPGYILRPCIGNMNWGGASSPTCNPPSQTLSLSFQ